ncbi:adenosylcobinamide-GDP ribazoletransferase [Halorubrum lacusprofundi]|jgi:adenosylcobinamide-GDP ribazoletransferase|uniref:Adenosylcobinamide-GDP ribazoletransferase n=1 Tax=Halorubrum lacusprofundi (strain ATCC 49239 / DSM 5036 / JCM 8891 / ACAM 34) TaxID=416348 RepID=COBS_HALLT|nr:adenosylcobinamide-GDP ribazoletransferase [Halorubrum lacusprofundi]B9LRL5.1 RecName: Full=Adenosylcobinamide-GDP ribazoletransferase; AltName: Full=Cobalamin synthase; AltName: Full=Cobalamin-5'-phosphate synthase [Halorubrum lacusprofundi ATCC 49239]ACM55838.1 cobalamin 5'-phosphate synthase [Halorubrum lacusprofundi ATCC 49239]MCG1006707.1 adenosylcobinamide-GDP ribazoletransferase [Halorubrum lacusprofundi]
MILTALRGALGFLTRIPVGRDEAAWAAFARSPWTFPVVGYLVGGLVALSLFVPAPAPTVALAFVLAVYAVTGIGHLDGVADIGDAAAVHGDREERRRVLKDSALGVGGTVALALVVLGLATAALGLVEVAATAGDGGPLPPVIGIVVAAEVGAKAATATLVCVGDAPHEGLGSALTGESSPGATLSVFALAAPAALLTWPQVLPGLAALLVALATAALVARWSRRRLGGVSGDVLGATTELARVAALHAGVIAWTRF